MIISIKGVALTGEYYGVSDITIKQNKKKGIKGKKKRKMNRWKFCFVKKKRMCVKVMFRWLLFTTMTPKREIWRKKLKDDKGIKLAISAYFTIYKDKTFVFVSMNKLIERSERFVVIKGKYIKKEELTLFASLSFHSMKFFYLSSYTD